MRKIRIVSDLHIEFDRHANLEYRLDTLDTDKETILVLAGDVCVTEKIKHFRYFFEDVNDRFYAVVYILGNHEYYRGNYPTVPEKTINGLQGLDNIYFLNDSHIYIDGILFIGGTLWTDMGGGDPICCFDAQRYMNDYKLIRTGTAAEPWKMKFRPAHSIDAHRITKKYIFEVLKEENADKVVVVTHHAPSSQSIDQRYKLDSQNPAYFSNLDDGILDNHINLWVHGHMHSSNDYMIGETRVINNPRGYLGSGLNPDYNNTLTIDV